MHLESHLYVNLRSQTRKNDFWGSPGPSPRGVTKSIQKGPGRQLAKNRPNDVSRAILEDFFEPSKFSDFLGGGLGASLQNVCVLRIKMNGEAILSIPSHIPHCQVIDCTCFAYQNGQGSNFEYTFCIFHIAGSLPGYRMYVFYVST